MSLFSRHVELYEFSRGPRVLRLTPASRPMIHGDLDYAAAPGLKRGKLQQTLEEARSQLGLTVPHEFPLLSWYRPFPPSERVAVRLLRVRTSDGAERVLFTGVVGEIQHTTHSVQIRCQTRLSTMEATGLRRCWQVSCPFWLYGPQCGVNADDYRVPATVFGGTPYTVQAAAFDSYEDGWFDGGFIRWQVGTDVELRFVVRHAGDTLHLLTPARLPAGLALDAFPGCDRTIATCHEKFDNALQYGGQHTMPDENPFEGQRVF